MAKQEEYPDFRISILRISKSRAEVDVAEHNKNMGELLRAGNYEIKSSSVSDSPAEIQIILVLQKRQ